MACPYQEFIYYGKYYILLPPDWEFAYHSLITINVLLLHLRSATREVIIQSHDQL